MTIGIVRTKAMAIFLGPAEFGFMSLYGSILSLSESFSGMGINGSGIRQIAEALGLPPETQVQLENINVRPSCPRDACIHFCGKDCC